MQRVPSGTLIVVGPIELDQQSWHDAGERISMACLQALAYGHRVAVLIDTPTPESLFEDVAQLARQSAPDTDSPSMLVGSITEEGEMKPRRQFASARRRPVTVKTLATADAIPEIAAGPLRKALEHRTSGLLMFGSAHLEEHPAIDLVAAALALTEVAGPAARIMPRHRGTPAKDWMVPDPIKRLPFLPSIESAFEQGYRRLIFTPGYTKTEVLLEYADKALLICGTYSADLMSIYMSGMRASGPIGDDAHLRKIIALLGAWTIRSKGGRCGAYDLFIMPKDVENLPTSFKEIERFLRSQRTLRSEDMFRELLASGRVSLHALNKEFPRDQMISAFVSQARKTRTSRQRLATGAKGLLN